MNGQRPVHWLRMKRLGAAPAARRHPHQEKSGEDTAIVMECLHMLSRMRKTALREQGLSFMRLKACQDPHWPPPDGCAAYHFFRGYAAASEVIADFWLEKMNELG